MISDNLMLNDDKTEFLIIGTRQQLAKVNINCIRVGSTDVCPVTNAFASICLENQRKCLSMHL